MPEAVLQVAPVLPYAGALGERYLAGRVVEPLMVVGAWTLTRELELAGRVSGVVLAPR